MSFPRITLALLALAALSTSRAAAQARVRRPVATPPATVITGTVRGADGAPLKLATVLIVSNRNNREQYARVTADADGKFAIATTRTGVLRLMATAVDHYPVSVPLVLREAATLGVTIALKHYEYTDSLEHVSAMGSFNGFNQGDTRPLVRQDDGTWALELDSVPGDTVAYELVRLEKSGARTIPGTQADRYAYDNDGDYWAIVQAHDRKVRIVLDPRKLVHAAGEESVVFADTAARAARIAMLLRAWDGTMREFFDSSSAARRRHDSVTNFDWQAVSRRAAAALRRERDPQLREAWLLELLSAMAFGYPKLAPDTALATRIIHGVSPSSVWWTVGGLQGPSIMTRAYVIAAGHSDRRGSMDSTDRTASMLYLERVAAEHPDSQVQVNALMSMLFMTPPSDAERRNELYLRIANGYPGSPEIDFLKSQFSPNRVMQVGRAIPQYRFASLDDTTRFITNDSLAGNIYLMHFWASWCGPCVAEMEQIQAAHDSLAPLGVEFFSISLDNSVADAQKFRADKWHMPWRQAYGGGGFNPQLQAMEILFIPRLVLVGRDGTILAVDMRENLVQAIRDAIRPPAPAGTP